MTYPWFSDEACRKDCEGFVRVNPQKDMDQLRQIATEGNLSDFRILCNCLHVCQYTPDAFYNMGYDESRELRDLCNNRVHTILGNLDQLYNNLFEVWRSERWNGDETWRLFCDAIKPYSEAQAILTVIDFNQYLGQPLTLENLNAVQRLYNKGRYWDLHDEDMYSYDIKIPSEFKKANEHRKEHTRRWRTFMKYIWEGDFTSGMKMLERYDKEREARIAEYRKKHQQESA